MFPTLALLLCLFFLLFASFYIFDKKFSSPSFAFAFAFVIAMINGLTNFQKWDFILSEKTIYTIGGGCFLVFVCCAFVHKSAILNHKNSWVSYLPTVTFSNKANILFFLLQLVSLILSLKAILEVGAKYHANGSLSGAISTYRTASLYFEDFTGVSSLTSNINLACTAISYFYIYAASISYLRHERQNILVYINSILAIISPLVYGGRGSSILLICLVIFVFLQEYECISKRSGRFTVGPIMVLLICFIILLIGFQLTLSLMGRSAGKFSLYYYLSIYIGAPIKNLDLFLTHDFSGPTFEGVETFGSLYTRIANLFGEQPEMFFTTFSSYDGYDLGNVYTTFRAYIHDYGFIGMIFLLIVLSIISQYMYEKTSCESNYRLIYIFLYSIVFYSLATSFFSNQFYKTFISITILKYIIIWIFCIYISKTHKFNFVKIGD